MASSPECPPVFPAREGLASLQHSLLRPPAEALAKFVRTAQKVVEKEVAAAAASVEKAPVPREDEPLPKRVAAAARAAKALEAAEKRLRGAKRKLADLRAQTAKYAGREERRVAHYEALLAGEAAAAARADPHAAAATATTAERVAGAAKRRRRSLPPEPAADDDAPPRDPGAAERLAVDRLVAQCLHRSGFHGAAAGLAREAGLEDLVDAEVFRVAQQVLAGLRAHDCSKALQWCGANRSRLARLRSPLEFELRLQEFAELARTGDAAAAVAHARARLVPAAEAAGEEAMVRVRESMGALAFCRQASGWGERYAPLFDEERWEELGSLFQCELYRLNGLAARPMLEVVLEAGLHALKTPACTPNPRSPEHSRRCPVCSQLGSRLAARLPVSHRTHSRLVCRLSGRIVDERNPPAALPNGSVYSRVALEAMAADAGGVVTDPRTGERFSLDECRTVYIL